MNNYTNTLQILKKKKTSAPMAVPLDAVDDVVFGRDEDCNIRITKKSVSSKHTRIFFDSNGAVRSTRLDFFIRYAALPSRL